MKASAESTKKRTPERSASQSSGNDTATKAIGFLMLFMTAIVLNDGQKNEGQDWTITRFAVTFLTLFIAVFILNKGQLGLGAIYLLLAQIAPPLRQPAIVCTLFMLYFFLMPSCSHSK